MELGLGESVHGEAPGGVDPRGETRDAGERVSEPLDGHPAGVDLDPRRLEAGVPIDGDVDEELSGLDVEGELRVAQQHVAVGAVPVEVRHRDRPPQLVEATAQGNPGGVGPVHLEHDGLGVAVEAVEHVVGKRLGERDDAGQLAGSRLHGLDAPEELEADGAVRSGLHPEGVGGAGAHQELPVDLDEDGSLRVLSGRDLDPLGERPQGDPALVPKVVGHRATDRLRLGDLLVEGHEAIGEQVDVRHERLRLELSVTLELTDLVGDLVEATGQVLGGLERAVPGDDVLGVRGDERQAVEEAVHEGAEAALTGLVEQRFDAPHLRQLRLEAGDGGGLPNDARVEQLVHRARHHVGVDAVAQLEAAEVERPRARGQHTLAAIPLRRGIRDVVPDRVER